jgi:hypothetical protein
LGIALVAGSMRVPKPAAGMTAFLIFMHTTDSQGYHIWLLRRSASP